MKYEIGDIVKIRRMRFNNYIIFQNKIGIIIEKHEGIDYIDYADISTAYPFTTYRIIVQGIEGKHFVYEEEIEEKLE